MGKTLGKVKLSAAVLLLFAICFLLHPKRSFATTYVYVANSGADSIAVIDTSTNTIVTSIQVETVL